MVMKKLKTKMHYIVTGAKIRFKDSNWVDYKLGAMDMVKKDFDSFKLSMGRSFKKKLYSEDPDKDIQYIYNEIEKCDELGSGNFSIYDKPIWEEAQLKAKSSSKEN